MITIKILTVYRPFLEEKCDLVIVPGDGGEYGILEDHVDVILKLEPGEVRFYREEKVIGQYFIFGGLASFSKNELSIMADEVKLISDLDLKHAESKLKFFDEEQRTVDLDHSEHVFNQVLLYRRMLEVGNREVF